VDMVSSGGASRSCWSRLTSAVSASFSLSSVAMRRSAFAAAWEEGGSDMLRRLFETVVQRCLGEGLVGADGFAVDANLIAADANKQRSIPSRKWRPEEVKENAVRAAREYLATLDNAAFGAASPVTPKFISRSDPAAQWTGAHKGTPSSPMPITT
jgi:hypothetical protein